MKINLSEEELRDLTDRMTAYAKLHQRMERVQSQIVALEGIMSKLREENDSVILDVELARADEQLMRAKLEAKYGAGSFDLSDLSWIVADVVN